MAGWQVQQAKSRLSELVEAARTQGPQVITRHGKQQAAVLSIDEYRRLCLLDMKSRINLWEALAAGPPFDDDTFENLRDKSPYERELDL